jgi:hypothetical protein
MVSSMKEVRISDKTNPFPFEDGSSSANRENGGILRTRFPGMRFNILGFWKHCRVILMIPSRWLIDARVQDQMWNRYEEIFGWRIRSKHLKKIKIV